MLELENQIIFMHVHMRFRTMMLKAWNLFVLITQKKSMLTVIWDLLLLVKLCTARLQRLSLPLQLCLCSLSDADRRVAHGQLVAMQFLMEDVVQNSYGCAAEDHADCQASLAKSKQVPWQLSLFGTVWGFYVGLPLVFATKSPWT